jgi:hypothetical protein
MLAFLPLIGYHQAMSRPAQILNLIDYASRRATEFSGGNRILTGATFLRPINEKLARKEKLKTTLSIQPCVIARSARIRREKARRSYRSSFACLIPGFDGALFSREWKDALWDRFFTAAPQRQRQSVEQYKIVKRA